LEIVSYAVVVCAPKLCAPTWLNGDGACHANIEFILPILKTDFENAPHDDDRSSKMVHWVRAFRRERWQPPRSPQTPRWIAEMLVRTRLKLMEFRSYFRMCG
jgi:hypothetical protein